MVTSKFTLTPQNGRSVRLTGGVLNLLQESNEDGIVKIYTPEGLAYTVGDTVYPKPKYPFKFNYIYQATVNGKLVGYDLVVAKLTTSSTFALPFLGGNRSLFMWDKLFINCFIGVEPDNIGEVIALLYRFSGDPLFLKFEEALCSFRNFIKRYDPDPYHVMFVFSPPASATKSFEHFINGRYSKIDDLWKLKILEFHGFDIDGHTGKILFQSESLRRELEEKLDVDLPEDSELFSILNMDYEVFNPELYLPKKHDLER